MGHLEDAYKAVSGAYSHPHYADRVKMIGAHLASLAAVIGHLPEEEASRAEHTARVMATYRAGEFSKDAPDHDKTALRHELNRIGG